jgi:hypothetical protein
MRIYLVLFHLLMVADKSAYHLSDIYEVPAMQPRRSFEHDRIAASTGTRTVDSFQALLGTL